jgi:hypothetical protein
MTNEKIIIANLKCSGCAATINKELIIASNLANLSSKS